MDYVKVVVNRQWPNLVVIVVVVIVASLNSVSLCGDPWTREFAVWWSAKQHLTTCRNNIQSLSLACEMYANDNGRLPSTLDTVCPRYIQSFPTCPAVGRSTYQYHVRADATDYTIFCNGWNHRHAGCNVDEPRDRGITTVSQ